MSVLEVKNIKKNFGKTEVLKGISFSLEKGEVLSIIGSSGSGKTTLLRCLNFLEFAESGTISVGGKIIFDGDAAKKPLGGLQIERLGSFNHGGTDGSRHGRAAGKRRQGRRGFLATARKEPDPSLRLR